MTSTGSESTGPGPTGPESTGPEPREESTGPESLEESTRRWQWAGLVMLGLFIAAFPFYRLYEPSRRAEARDSQLGYLAAQGQDLYASDCSSCHGVDGRGGLGPALGSRNFLESVDDDGIAQLISLGVPGTEMVAYSIDYGGPMTSEEIRAITTYLRSLEEESVENPNWQTPLADANLAPEDLYTLACLRCHGADRTGIADVAPDISPTSLTMGETDEFLVGRIRDGRNEMPRFGRVLTAEQIDALVLFLRGGAATTTTTSTTPPESTPSDTTTTTTTTEPPSADTEMLAVGKEIFEVTAGGVGCASCHGFDGQGTADGPNIIGVSKTAISTASGGGVPDMDNISLTPEELEAVYSYLQSLSS